MLNNRPIRIITGSILFMTALLIDQFWDTGMYRLLIYLIPYLVSGHYVIFTAIQNTVRGNIFDEFSLMSIATLGAFIIGEYPEGVFVMLFYEIGEFAQHKAVNKARTQIDSLLGQRPDTAKVQVGDEWKERPADEVEKGSLVMIHKGEQVPIDGILADDQAVFNTASITGEPQARQFSKGQQILSGYINEGGPVKIKTNSLFEESTFSRIIRLTRQASENKAPTEAFFRRFARIYTPVVAILALGILIAPWFFVDNYQWQTWLYRACVFLVISCPCALVLSIPLTYFAGIGAAGRSGILAKGANYLDQLSKLSGIVFDKTGTLTKGELEVAEMEAVLENEEVLRAAKTLSAQSSHPASRTISKYLDERGVQTVSKLEEVEEKSGSGIQGKFKGELIQLGSPAWIGSDQPVSLSEEDGNSLVYLSFAGKIAYIFNLSDELKEDAKDVIHYLNESSIHPYLLSGDREQLVQKYGTALPFYKFKGEVSPEDKLKTYKHWKDEEKRVLAFAGDGINDSIVMAASDLGIAMGKKGADIVIEAADIIIPGDRLAHIPQAIQIGRKTQTILWQNIIIVLFVKLLVLALGGLGFVSLWMAILADVGIALLAVLNASRLAFYRPEWKQ